MSFASQRPVKIKLDHEFIDRSLLPADDDTWANRIVVHSAAVINYCFGSSGPNRVHYQELVDYDQAWLRARPVSWLPIAYSAPDKSLDEVFPHIIYLNHAVGACRPPLIIKAPLTCNSYRSSSQHLCPCSFDVP